MKKIPLFLLLAAGLCVDSQAQSFGDFLKNAAADAARQAVAGNVRQAVTNAVDSAAQGITRPAAASAAGAEAQPAAVPAVPAVAVAAPAVPPGCMRMKGTPLDIGARPDSFQPAGLWPEDTGCPVYNFRDLKFDTARAAKSAFREASKVRCNDCEGGWWFDAWGGRSLIKEGDYSREFPKLLASLEPGQSVGWKGNRYQVSITAIGNHPIGEVPCKQFHYVLKDKDKQVAEYDGMYCEYRSPYASNPTWNEIV